jgi:hypothetical protein
MLIFEHLQRLSAGDLQPFACAAAEPPARAAELPGSLAPAGSRSNGPDQANPQIKQTHTGQL